MRTTWRPINCGIGGGFDSRLHRTGRRPLIRWGQFRKEFSTLRQVGRSAAAMIAAIASRPREPAWQDVQRVSLHELATTQPIRLRGVHASLLLCGLVGRPLWSSFDPDFILIGRDDSAVRDWAARQVTGQVFDHIGGITLPRWRAFDEHVPIDRCQFCLELLSELGVAQKFNTPTKLELAFLKHSR